MTNHPLLVASLAAAMLMAAPGSAQELSPELQALDAQLPGDLINDPSTLEWENYGANYDVEGKSDDNIPGGGAALRYEIKRAGANPYDVGANIALLADISRGETVTVGFYARTISADTVDGQGVIGVRFGANTPPYKGFGETTVGVATQWDWYEVSAVSDMAITRRDAVVAMHMAGAKQAIEIGQTIVVKGAPSIVAAAPAQAAKAPAAELPAPLQGSGRSLNDPQDRNWSSNGPGGSVAPREEPGIWLGNATRFASASVGDNPWDIGTAIPVGAALAQGDRIMVAIAARTQSAQTADGKSVVGIRIQDSQPPYAGFGDKSFKVGSNWQLIRVPFTVTQAMAAERATVSLHFAGAAQEVDIGPVYIFAAD
ncbi:hypothetical protein [Altererythrobacter sp. ZODW24]|uniref:hypothetical protein n=1 Tax=Altererythrobacter sp. ZODW24 TaxID=2185142 RepID=UPI000DF76595|nr:hypothetical protein [Altererythrobacter sp. ZODW24]